MFEVAALTALRYIGLTRVIAAAPIQEAIAAVFPVRASQHGIDLAHVAALRVCHKAMGCRQRFVEA